MNKTIQKFRLQFIVISIASLAIVLFSTVGLMIGTDFSRAHGEATRVMSALVRNNGQLTPQDSHEFSQNQSPFNALINNRPNPDSVYQYRYFSVAVNNNKLKILNWQNSKVYGVSQDKILNVTRHLLNKKQTKGVTILARNTYSYEVIANSNGKKMVVFLNTSLIYERSWSLLRLAILLTLGALVFFAIILIILSKRAIQPVVRSYEKQQQFITNAGHELKTPLAIISANTEMEEMMGNESEWTQSTKQQTARLTKLINQLISMARLGETGDLVLSKVNFSEIVEESAKSFSSVIKNDGKTYQIAIQSGLYVMAEKQSLMEVVNILLDNAHKYCTEKGIVKISLHKNRFAQTAVLRVSNSFKNGKNINYETFFDRFYREDESHNNKKSGYGIGLAMARDTIHAFNGKINVSYKDGMIHFDVVLKLVK
ncbi:HAMP domain-containing sensor histidine kinase [Lactobacillus sp. LL6]|uniref:sensor histidine kinase n=1 Tax=Lactobacillus sp. LL6 TaxID=2596827 RepID=UPI001185B002|nr:HAMP domain-containing sensor histidine kinase [Lactobacillus sp. LL6]TSO25396.1 HAMP domain-containing histidine kinase [Lactobacillus sp. LL6]